MRCKHRFSVTCHLSLSPKEAGRTGADPRAQGPLSAWLTLCSDVFPFSPFLSNSYTRLLRATGHFTCTAVCF